MDKQLWEIIHAHKDGCSTYLFWWTAGQKQLPDEHEIARLLEIDFEPGKETLQFTQINLCNDIPDLDDAINAKESLYCCCRGMVTPTKHLWEMIHADENGDAIYMFWSEAVHSWYLPEEEEIAYLLEIDYRPDKKDEFLQLSRVNIDADFLPIPDLNELIDNDQENAYYKQAI